MKGTIFSVTSTKEELSMADVALQKVSSIERCLQRIKEEHELVGDGLEEDLTRQDAIILNLQRACEQSIDLANHIIKKSAWGFPERSRDSFDVLVKKGLLFRELGDRMKKMVGFRNLAIHEYQSLNIKILQPILNNHLSDFEDFGKLCLKWNHEHN